MLISFSFIIHLFQSLILWPEIIILVRSHFLNKKYSELAISLVTIRHFKYIREFLIVTLI